MRTVQWDQQRYHHETSLNDKVPQTQKAHEVRGLSLPSTLGSVLVCSYMMKPYNKAGCFWQFEASPKPEALKPFYSIIDQ